MHDETTPDDVLEFWFGDDETPADERSDIWWGQADDQEALDAEIRERFGTTLRRAGAGELEHWREDPRSRLALIIVVDQFSRNIHRGSSDAFAHDAVAREATLEGIDRGHDRELPELYRIFFFMPLMHAEDLDLQNLGVEKFRELAEEASDETVRKMASGSADYAVEHRDIIEAFGRFPHRNPLLGREMTEEEAAYLEETGNWYGQKPDD